MPTEIVVEAEDRPGAIATVGELLGEVGVNITAAAAFTQDGRGYIHVVVDQADKAVAALHEASWSILRVKEVLTVTLDDQPGALGRFARRLGDRGINITSLYLAGARGGEKELVVVVDDLSHARKHL
ncbi:MAG: ACT domain-containing protein [Actinomycetota bacterium]